MVFLYALLLAGCGGGASAGTQTPVPTSLHITVNGKSASQVVLTEGGFLNPNGYSATLGVDQNFPAGTVVWSTSTPAITLGTTDPHYLSGSPTPPPNGIFALLTPNFGKTIVTATAGNLSASIPVYTYSTIALRCQFRYAPAYSFAPFSQSNGLSSDLYVTVSGVGAGDELNPCFNSVFITGADKIHVPYGGVIISNPPTFQSVSASQWSNSLTQTTESALGGFSSVLLFKTKTGAIVKVILPVGPIEITDSTGNFPY